MSTLAALDVGTNSFHLIIARTLPNGRFEVMTREKSTVRLGHGGGDMKRIEPEALERGVVALERMRRIAESNGAPLRAVATSAVREAENAEEFIAAARDRAAVDVEVISGIEEARLIHLGILQAVPAFDRRLLMCDIGGGSTELLIGERGEPLAARSLKLGAVRLTDRFFNGGDGVTASAVRTCRDFVRSSLSAFEREVAQHGFDVAVGSSGSIEAVFRLAHAATGRPEPRTFNCAEITRAELKDVVKRLVSVPKAAQRRALPGMEPDRADIAPAGALILEGVVEAFGIERLTFSDYALREGVLLDTMQRSAGADLHHLRDVVRRGVEHLVETCDDDPSHSAHVAGLALQLFDALQPLHGLDENARSYLEAAALLANVGLFISHSQHHLHSYYVIRNSESLMGLTDSEIEIIALVARYHRKSAPKPTHAEFMRLDLDQQEVVRTLAGILRVAIGLDRSHDGRVGKLAVRRKGRTLRIEATPVATANIELELYAANERSALLGEVLGMPVEVAAAGDR